MLLWQLNGAQTHRKACLIGWAFGFGQFAIGFYWISVSMFTDIAHWWWAVPFASTILPILLGFIPGFAAMIWWRMRLTGIRRILMFAAWIMIGEWVRGHFLTGFPWNLTGHTWIAWLPLLQSYSFLGAYGLGFITVAVACLPSLMGSRHYLPKTALAWNGAGLSVLVALALWGVWRVPHGPSPVVPGAVVRLVQPNIPQGEKWSPELSQKHFTTLVRLSQQRAQGPAPSYFVWPETAVPYPLDLSPSIPIAIGAVAPANGLVMTGVLRRDFANGKWSYYNSLEIVDAHGRRLGHYDKTHLAPFGEYMPFRNVLPLDALAVGGTDLSFGHGPVTLDVPGLPSFSPLICYEAIFSERAVDEKNRPGWLLQVTNDGWFGNSSGPYQHFAMARARAVEQGMPLLRAANTGISGAVDPYGRVLGSLPIGVQGIMDTQLPEAIGSAPFYARFGDVLFLAMVISTLIFSSRLLQREVG